jgi:dihydrodipicolinate synthase/N-acetylneuraminate lyase
MKISLPSSQGKMVDYNLVGQPIIANRPSVPFNRTAFAAAHVVANPMCESGIDWEGTLSYRRHLLNLGFGIAEAMDTSQRGMGLTWPDALELIKRSLQDAGEDSFRIYSGCGTDHVVEAKTLDDVIAAYLSQLHAIQKLGGRIILMASRALVQVANSPDDYIKVYSRVLQEADHPVILHWLGPMFDPALRGYWGSDDFASSMNTALRVIQENLSKVDGIKISLLDAEKEITLRQRLPESVKMYTGDDFNYADLIAGDQSGYSHALLGIFDAIAPAASVALSALANNELTKFYAVLAPTVPLSRLIFQSPTQFYKTGIVFMAWLNDHQNHFTMVNGAQSGRSILHFSEVFRLADQANLLRNPDLAVKRMKQLLAIYGL